MSIMGKDLKLAEKKEELSNAFVLIEASKLSHEDELMKYLPHNDKEVMFKEEIRRIISHEGINDFYAPRFNPSINWKDGGVRFSPGYKPAVGKSYKWWLEKSKSYASDCGSRLGTKSEYVVFLGQLIKNLISDGWSAENAWKAVCVDSRELGHYKNSDDAKNDFELTGSRGIGGFSDLGNTWKILAEDEEKGGFWLAGGDYIDLSYYSPLFTLGHDKFRSKCFFSGVGWIVLEKR